MFRFFRDSRYWSPDRCIDRRYFQPFYRLSLHLFPLFSRLFISYHPIGLLIYFILFLPLYRVSLQSFPLLSSLFISYYPIVPACDFFIMFIPYALLYSWLSWSPPYPYKVAGCSQAYDVPSLAQPQTVGCPFKQDGAWLQHSKNGKWHVAFVFVICFSNAGLRQSVSSLLRIVKTMGIS